MSDAEAHDGIEAALARLRPAEPAFQRERLVYLAGQASGRRVRWRLALLTAFVGVGVGMAGTYLSLQGSAPAVSKPHIVVIHVPVPTPAEQPHAAPPTSPLSTHIEPAPATTERDSFFQFVGPADSYLQMRGQAVLFGVESLPMARPTSAFTAPPPQSNLLKLQSEQVGKASDL